MLLVLHLVYFHYPTKQEIYVYGQWIKAGLNTKQPLHHIHPLLTLFTGQIGERSLMPNVSVFYCNENSFYTNSLSTDTAYVASASTNGTAALTSVTVTIKMDEKGNTVIEDIQHCVLHRWFNEGSSVPTLLKVHDDFENGSPYVRIALCKGINVSLISLSVDDAMMDVDKQWSVHVLESSAMGLTGGSWINGIEFRCYTLEGEGLLFHFDAQDVLTLDEEAHKKISSKLVQKYKQQWIDEQAKADNDDIICASDALPYLFGAADSFCHMYTAIYFA